MNNHSMQIRTGKVAFRTACLLAGLMSVVLRPAVAQPVADEPATGAPAGEIDLSRIPSAQILPGTTDENYRDPAAICHAMRTDESPVPSSRTAKPRPAATAAHIALHACGRPPTVLPSSEATGYTAG